MLVREQKFFLYIFLSSYIGKTGHVVTPPFILAAVLGNPL